MKIIALAVLLATGPAFGATNDLRQVVRNEAQRCADALLSGDYETVIGYTHPRIVELMGGKGPMLETLKRSTKDMAAKGVAVEKIAISVPDQPKTSGGLLYAMIPETMTIKSPGGTTTKENMMVGLSYDAGKKWVFIDADALTDPATQKALPELVGKIAQTPAKPPVFVKDPATTKQP
ncbi:MAG TPA: hypothetical protein VLZ30_11675 [Verrucomicrobiae bacterium]|nr:hypothetical protein [Verrucomicrobiae bacterium]